MSLDYCRSGGNDVDQDGLTDYCEDRLAYNFRPELRISGSDDVGREPYYAVHNYGSQYVDIAYLLSYYYDEGSTGWRCQTWTNLMWLLTFGFDKEDYCHGHIGDSEFIIVRAQYNAGTSHWVLNSTFLSAHWHSPADGSGWHAASQLAYPAKFGWYPSIYVAYGKHANYVSQDACNGGALGNDECFSTVGQRLEHVASRNVGSSQAPTQFVPGNTHGCVASQGRFAGNGRSECYWMSGDYFEGWQVAEAGYYATPYFDVLNEFDY